MRNSALAWIGHPLTVVTALVLLANDHLFKSLWPGLVTGKLSDVAGLIVAPPLLNLLVRLPRTAIVVTGAAFTLVKTTAVGAALASQAWTLVWGPSQILADPTDLVALPALYFAWWIFTHPGPHAARRARAVVVIPLVVLAVTATGAVEYSKPYSAYAADVLDGTIIVATVGGTQRSPVTGFASNDAGRTWSAWQVPVPRVPRTSSCVPGPPDRCYRIVPGRLKVEESRDGRWVTAWEISPGDQDRLARAHVAKRPEETEIIESLGIATGKLGGGHVVVVANGADGIVLRDTTGVWRRMGWAEVGFAPSAAMPLTAPGRFDRSVPVTALLAALAAGLMTLICAMRIVGFTVSAIALWTGILMCCWATNWPVNFDPPAALLGVMVAAIGAVGMLLSSVDRSSLRLWAIGTACTFFSYHAMMAPFYAWSDGRLQDFSVAVRLSVVLWIVSASVSALAVIRLPKRAGNEDAPIPAGSPEGDAGQGTGPRHLG
ncbi:hypothetical protein [Sphaerisporangium sp. NPDC051011]|uniref:hypothetical protein n=1 Tax=Sphaerisporangium sp. NPDC051011 TaxID=3155792 RepID=UPI0033F8D9AD